ncbi:MAG TPA: hypothetical protein VIK30_06700, partial [Polyangia bacterium]
FRTPDSVLDDDGRRRCRSPRGEHRGGRLPLRGSPQVGTATNPTKAVCLVLLGTAVVAVHEW